MATEQQIGDFKIIKKLGQGGMGEVFLAHQISLDRQVALKVMAKQFCTQENFAKRFIREAQTMAKLDHPNIVPILETDVDVFSEGSLDEGSLLCEDHDLGSETLQIHRGQRMTVDLQVSFVELQGPPQQLDQGTLS